jgi:hypothetical protein
MKQHARCLALLIAAGLTTAAARAAEAPSNADSPSFYGGAGAFGLGLGYAHRIGDHWAARVQVNSGSLARANGDTDFGDIHYDTRLKLGAGLSALADYYPSLDSGWRLTGGLIFSRINSEVTGRPDAQGGYLINQHRYSATQVGALSGRVKFGPTNLYLGGGWDSAPLGTRGWRFVSDVGVFYAGKGSATLEATGAANNPALLADLNAERDQLRKMGVGVAVTLGAAYAF